MAAAAAYYNEIDPLKAEVLREAIKAGAIAPGDVDERSIVDVEARDLVGYRQCHFFAGGGFWSLALRQAGWPDDREVWTGSCPCPSFSAAGKGAGLTDPRHLWPHWFRLARKRRPRRIFGEQVAAAAGHGWYDIVSTDLEAQGYAIASAVLGAHSVGGPHIRQRLYFVADAEDDGRNRRRPDHARHDATQKPKRRGHPDELGDAESRRLGEHRRAPRNPGHPDITDAHGVMGEPIGTRLEGHAGHGGDRHKPGRIGARATRSATATGTSGIMADADGHGCVEAGQRESAPWHDGTPGDGALSGMADSADGQLPQPFGGPDRRNGNGSDSAHDSGVSYGSGPLNGFWRDADWIGCRDGKFRPVEPGTFPLAHGSAARVGRLRMYGDGIVVTAAQAFIEAYLDCERLGGN